MNVASRLVVVLAASALAACGSVQSGGNDAGGPGGVGGSSGSNGGSANGGDGGSAGTNGERGGAGGALAGAGGVSTGRGGASGSGGIGGMSGVGGSPGRGGAGGSGINCVNGSPCPGFCIPGQVYCNGICVIQCQGGGGTTGTAGTGGAAGRGGAGGGAGGAAGGGSTGRGGSGGGMGGAGGRKSCQSDGECQGFKCCGGFCVNPGNDVLNCGTCGNTCSGDHRYCANGNCQSIWPCTLVGAACNPGSTCCGGGCCTGTQICCTVTLGPDVTGCFEPVNGTCPTGCSGCNCAAPTTPVATPMGDRPIADIKVGDLVYSIDHGSLAIVPIKLVHRQPVIGSHRVVELKLAHGATLRISPRHPTADGRHFADLAAGDVVDGVHVIAARLVDYDQPFTYDILPYSDSGAYFAGGTLIGSTLSAQPGGAVMTPGALGSGRRASLVAPKH